MNNWIVASVIAGVVFVQAHGQTSYPPGASQADVASLVASTPQFVNTGAFQSTAQLLTSFPCSSALLGKLGHVSDLYGSVSSTLVCENDSVIGYYWRPQRTDYASVSAQASGSMILTPLQSAPVVYLTSTPTGSVTITPSTTNVWPGATFRIYAPSTITLNGITINNLVGGGTVPLLQGSDKLLTYTAAGWKSN